MKREIRSSSVAGAAGVGAIIDVGQESFLIPGIEQWKQPQLRVVELKRLSARLGKVLKAPREDSPSLMVRRFPRAMFCEKCRRIAMWKTAMERENLEPACPANGCGGRLVPMRFVLACENGHLDDIEWWRWAHSGPYRKSGCQKYDQLSFNVDSSAETGGLASVRVECACGSWRSLEELANRNIVKETFQQCTGAHPWIKARENCTAEVVILQRGATNLHYPSTISALDIPTDVVENPVAEYADQIRRHPKYSKLVDILKDATGDTSDYINLCAEFIATEVGCDLSVVLELAKAEAEGVVHAGTSGDEQPPAIDQAILLDEEWRTLEAAMQEGGMSGAHFVALAEELEAAAPRWMKALVNGVLLIRRLREVRAYLGFQRVKPGTPDQMVRPDVGSHQNWLPVSEVFGEGVLINFNFDILEKWAYRLPDAEKEALRLLESKRIDDNFWFLPMVEPIFLGSPQKTENKAR